MIYQAWSTLWEVQKNKKSTNYSHCRIVQFFSTQQEKSFTDNGRLWGLTAPPPLNLSLSHDDDVGDFIHNIFAQIILAIIKPKLSNWFQFLN
jgi:hypothetical protein